MELANFRWVSFSAVMGALAVCFFPAAAAADLFTFKDGRVISGRVIGAPTQTVVDGVSTETWAVEVDEGIVIKVLKKDLAPRGHEPLSEPRETFEKNAAKMPDTLEALQTLIEFCSKNGMQDVSAALCEFRVDLAPDDSAIRHAANYKQDANGVWRREEEIYILQRGMVQQRGGRWRYPEAIAIEQAEEARKQELADATKDIVRWHRTVTSRYAKASSKQYQEAMRGLQQVDNPLATGVLSEFLADTDVPVPLRLMYVQLLGRLRNPGSAGALANAAVVDPDSQVRNACMDELQVYGANFATDLLIKYLGNGDNAFVNRAADTIAQLNSDGAVLPLINALVTSHTVVPNVSDLNVSGSGGLSRGGNKPITLKLENPSVRAALTHLTGMSFGYDRDQWMNWYASVNGPPALDLRRDWP